MPNPATTVVGWAVSTVVGEPAVWRCYLNPVEAEAAAIRAVTDGAGGARIQRFWADGLEEVCYVVPEGRPSGVRVLSWDVNSCKPFWRIK